MHRQLKIAIDRQHIIGYNEGPHPYIAGGYGGADHYIHCAGDYWW